MPNNYYTFPSPFIPSTKVRSEQVNVQYQGLESAFDLLPTTPASLIIGTIWFGTDAQGASVNEYLITTADPQLILTNGQRISFFATHTNSGAVTVNLDSLGLVSAVDGDGAALGASALVTGQWYELIYDSSNTRWVLQRVGFTGSTTAASLSLAQDPDLVDTTVPLNVGSATPDSAQHIEVGFSGIQSKSDATTAADLNLNPLGGTVNLAASVAAAASLNIAEGIAPSAPVDGDHWVTAAGEYFVQLDGVSVDLVVGLGGAAIAGGAFNQIQYHDGDGLINGIAGSTHNDLATTTSWLAYAAQAGLTAGNVMSISSNLAGKTAQVVDIVQDHASSVAAALAVRSDGTGPAINVEGGIRFLERADHQTTPVATFGELWVRDDAPNVLVFTDDTGVDTVFGTAGGSDTELQYNNGTALAGMPTFVHADAATTGNQFGITPLAGLTTGTLLAITSNISGMAGKLLHVHQDHATAFGTALEITQDSNAGVALKINANAVTNNAAIDINATGISSVHAIDIQTGTGSGGAIVCSTAASGGSVGNGIIAVQTQNLTNAFRGISSNTGARAAHFLSTIASRTVPVVQIDNDHATGTGIALGIKQDQSAPHIELTGTNGEGIKFAAAQDSTDVNTLDDYEEGTFTPTVQDDSLSNGEGQTYTTQDGEYTKIGNRVFFELFVLLSSKGSLTAGDQVQINGLPFNSSSSINFSVNVSNAGALAILAGEVVTGFVNSGQTYINLYIWDATTGTSVLTIANLTATSNLRISGSYTV